MDRVSIKQLKTLFLLLISVAIGIAGMLWHFSSTSYFAIFPVTYNSSKFPIIDVKIENDIYALTVSVGSKFPLFLNKEVLDHIEKKPHENTEWYDIDGKRHEAPSYLIPKMKMGDLIVTNIIAVQSAEESKKTLGRFLGKEFNLFLDFPHSQIIACNSFTKLKNKRLVDNHWIQVPFEMSRMGPSLQVKTDLGIHRLALNTTSSTSTLKPSIIGSKEPFTSFMFSIEGREFKTVLFNSIELPEKIHEIDGFIGMDFLKNHAIYLDYSNKIAYIEPSPIYFEYFPVTFGSCKSPYINICIENDIYSLKIDLGSNFQISLSQKILQNIHKTYYGSCEWLDFRGNKYESLAYIIPEIKMGNLILTNALASQDSEDFRANVNFNTVLLPQDGSIGRPILEKHNLLLDFRHSALYACNSLLSLQQKGLLSENLLTIPFSLHPDGIVLSIETDMGTHKLLLDTGSTRTTIRALQPALRPSQPIATSQFRLMGHDFGAFFICPINLNPLSSYEGTLGMDFLQNHSLFIDYPNKVIYLDLQKDNKP